MLKGKVRLLLLSVAWHSQLHWNVLARFNTNRESKKLSCKVSCSYINTPYLASLFVLLIVFAYCTLKRLRNLFSVFFSLADHYMIHLLPEPVLKATSFIEKCSSHFHTDDPRGWSDFCQKHSQTIYFFLPLPLPPSRDPLGSRSDPPPSPNWYSRTHEQMSPFDLWLGDQFIVMLFP